MFHKLFVSDKRAMELYNGALENIDKAKKDAVKEEYKESLEKLELDDKNIKKITDEEAAAAYWEEIFDIPGVWEYVLSGKPTLKDKILSFFSGKAKDFDGTIVSEQAKKLIEKYKNQFDRLAKKNKGRNAYDNSTERYDVVSGNEKDDVKTTDGSNTAENAKNETVKTTDEQKKQDSGRRSSVTALEKFSLSKKTNSSKNENDVLDLTSDNELSRIITNVHGSQRYRMIAEYIKKALGKQIVLSDGLEAIIDNRDASHIASGSGNEKAVHISKIKDVVSRAVLYAYENNVKHNKFSDFLYYRTKVKYDDKVYPLYLNVGKGINDKKYHLYDLTKKIRDTANRINGFERPKPNEGYALENDISATIIPENSEKSNSSDKNSSEKLKKAIENGRRSALKKDEESGPSGTPVPTKEGTEDVKAPVDGVAVKAKKEKTYSREHCEGVVDRLVSNYLSFGEEYAILEPGKRSKAVNMLYKGLNTAPAGERGKVAIEISEYIIDNAVVAMKEEVI